jgi:hypothetical protein
MFHCGHIPFVVISLCRLPESASGVQTSVLIRRGKRSQKLLPKFRTRVELGQTNVLSPGLGG